MRLPSTVAAWVRRERLLASVLAVAAAAAALSGPLGIKWLLIAALVVAAIGGVARIVIVAQQGRLERDAETAELSRRLRVPVRTIGEIDPHDLGVEPAAQQVLKGGESPEYVPRGVDDTLREAIDRAVDNAGRWIVVVSGPSKAGKTRTLVEALLHCKHSDQVALVAPHSAESLRSLIALPLPKPGGGLKPVLWLDDLEPFVAAGVTLETLRQWHEQTGMPVLATYGGKGSERMGDSPGMRELAELTRMLLQHAREVFLTTTSRLELEQLPGSIRPDLRAAIERHGLGAYLVAAPMLERKLVTRRHGPGDRESVEGAALVHAAVDWSLCGRTDGIPIEGLRRLWAAYLPSELDASDELFQASLAWASKPVAGNVALIHGHQMILPFDYVVAMVRDNPVGADPTDEAWDLALEKCGSAEAFAVGVSAWSYDRSDKAIKAFGLARANPNEALAGLASFDLALAYRRAGDLIKTREAYEWAIDSRHPEAAPNAAAALGVLLQQSGDLAGARAAYQLAIDSGHSDAAPRASVSLGILCELAGDRDGARLAYQFAVDSGHVGAASMALFQLGALREQDGDLQAARGFYERAFELGQEDLKLAIGRTAVAAKRGQISAWQRS
jgi:tetratricopeptide (TPR) repeat protein/methylmalonyl-CoA mutase cobalamin-binding subunit